MIVNQQKCRCCHFGEHAQQQSENVSHGLYQNVAHSEAAVPAEVPAEAPVEAEVQAAAAVLLARAASADAYRMILLAPICLTGHCTCRLVAFSLLLLHVQGRTYEDCRTRRCCWRDSGGVMMCREAAPVADEH